MAVITVSREIGSQGTAIARQAAAALGYHAVDKDLIEQVFTLYDILEFREIYDAAPGQSGRLDWAKRTTIDLLNRVTLALARHGNTVIIGRGSFAVLGGFADVLNVRIQAPLPVRAQRIMAERRILDLERATALVKELDLARAGFVESAYGVRWDNARAFDLVIDTGKITPELAANWLRAAVRSLGERSAGAHPAGGQPTAAGIEVDRTLANVLCEVLACERAH
jgi:cytidylate kinase